ncbi:hypothetical protein [uncultured Enterovirga sp.]|uniref:hypothetical protein n=1 Tax=uncultured Enterovirga sp. TaxID=2026352 RepID=UPI0035CA72C4
MGLDEVEMGAIEAAILAAPSAHPVVRGLRGVRKARFARRGTGKSGGGRAIYLVLIRDDVLAMLTAYPKSEKGDLTPGDRKAILRVLDGLGSGEFP